MRSVLAIIQSGIEGLGKNADQPSNILIVPLFKAQNALYQRALKALVDDASSLPGTRQSIGSMLRR